MSSANTRQKTEDTKDVVYACVGICIIILNITEIRLISQIRHRKTFDKLLLSLAASDVVVGISVAVYKLFDLSLGRNGLKWSEESTFAHVFLFTLIFSFCNLFAISIDRYLAVKFPIRHRIILTARRSNLAILAVWLFSLVPFLFNILMIIFWADYSQYFLQVSSVMVLVFGVFLVAIYTSILSLIYRSRVKLSRESQDLKTRFQMLVSIFRTPGTTERNVFISSCFVTISFIISTYPFAIEFLVKQSGNTVSFTSKLLILLNSLLNPFTYFFKSYLCSKYCNAPTMDIGMASAQQM